MRINPERLQELKALLKKQYGLEYTDEQAQEAGMAIVRFVVAKHYRAQLLRSKDNGSKNGQAGKRISLRD